MRSIHRRIFVALLSLFTLIVSMSATVAPAVAETVTAPADPVVHFVIDVSGSMSGSPLEMAKDAIGQAAADLPASTAMGLRSYAGSCDQSAVQPVVPIGLNNLADIESALTTLRAGGGTPTTAALGRAVEDIRAYGSSGSQRLVLLTDGDNGCGIPVCEYVKGSVFADIDVALYTVGLGVSASVAQDLECASEYTGGKFIPADQPGDLKDALGAAAGGFPSIVGPVGLTDPCQDVVFIGARGSGQSEAGFGMGAELSSAVLQFIDTMGKDYHIGYRPVTYSAAPVPITDWRLLATWEGFAKSADRGVEWTESWLRGRSTFCPDERYVLGGYSQGGMVMHRVLWNIALDATFGDSSRVLLPRIAGVILVADGDRVAWPHGNHLGTAPQKGSFGVAWSPFRGKNEFRPDRRGFPQNRQFPMDRVFSICAAGDIVCDWTAGRFQDGISIHTDSYADGDHQRHVLSAAEAIANSYRGQWAPAADPLTIRTSSLPDAYIGETYEAFLEASGGEPPYTWSVESNLPSGFVLDPATGRVSGTASDPFWFRVTFGVEDAAHVYTTRSVTFDGTFRSFGF